MLNWIAYWIGNYIFQQGGPLQGAAEQAARHPDLRRRRPQRAAAGLLGRRRPAGPAHRLLRRDRRARRLLADPQPHDARLRGACGRLQPGRRRLRRDQGPHELHPGDGDLGRVRRASRAASTCSATSTTSARSTCRPRRSASSGSRSRCSAATPRVGVGLAAFLFGGLLYGTTHGLQSGTIDPSLAGHLTEMIQGLVVLFVGADVLILCRLELAQEAEARSDPRQPTPAEAASP